MYAEIIVNRPIVKPNRRSFIQTSEDAAIPAPEIESPEDEEEKAPDDNPLALAFHYHVSEHLSGQIQPGQLVAVPFRTQQLTGIVLRLSDYSPIEQTRPVEAILDLKPVLNPAQLELACWLSYEFLTPLAACLKYFLPPGSNRKPQWALTLVKATHKGQVELNAPEQILLTYLRQNGTVPLDEVEPAAAESLIEKGLARKEATLSQSRVGPKVDRTVELLIPPDEIEAVLPSLGRASKQADLLLYLAESDDPLPGLDYALTQVGCSKGPARSLADKGLIEFVAKQTRIGIPPTTQETVESQETDLNLLTESADEQTILHYLAKHPQPIPLDEIKTITGARQATINSLIKKGLAVRFDDPERILLKLDPAELTDTVIELRGAQKYADVLKLLADEEDPVWIGWVYARTGANLQILRQLATAGLIDIDEARRWRDPLAAKSFTLDQPPELTPEQKEVWQTISRTWQPGQPPPNPILLHGVTGSGKTEIYLQTIAAALKAGQGAIFLVPEITLATQTVQRVAARFPDKVAIWHSALSAGERFDTWERVRSGELPIVVGPRSALFAPVENLGVIIVDEEHEPAYKQRDRSPAFHAREAALELGRLSQALVILGSATPDIVTYRKAERGQFRLLSLPNRVLAHTKHMAVQRALLERMKTEGRKTGIDFSHASALNAQPSTFVTLPLPRVEVVDLREELRAGNRTIFSRALQDAMRDALNRGEQVILFLNRRGTASFVICRDCGYVMACPQCDTTLTYHADGQLMMCHYCGYRSFTPEHCPECNSNRIRYFGLGTQRVEDAVKAMFPKAQTIRWDWDTTRQKGSHDVFLQHFIAGRANVMVGTQMVAKGLDLPLVTVVGVISADTALYLPDFRAAERTFQLLMQVAGRAGRSPLGGRVIVQSYTPDQVAIEAASRHDYEGFYQMELGFRYEQRYPPFKRLALLLYSGPGQERSRTEAHQLAQRLRLHIARQGLPAVDVIGPTPSYVQRVRNQYRWHILLRAADPTAVLRPLIPLPRGWRVDVDPVSLL